MEIVLILLMLAQIICLCWICFNLGALHGLKKAEPAFGGWRRALDGWRADNAEKELRIMQLRQEIKNILQIKSAKRKK